MGRNLIICSDGTGNTFNKRVTNVTSMIKCLALDRPNEQLVVYDQGVGAGRFRTHDVEAYRDSLVDHEALTILTPSKKSQFWPKIQFNRIRGLLFGYGIKENVRQMYLELSNLYMHPDDRVFLFGFSRGAFTVRALAGLLYRCQLPGPKCQDLEQRFERAWKLYTPRDEDEDNIKEFRTGQRPCRIHFLGIWDTVKSYGGIVPIVLPHLRHNPIVSHVRHALALDEQRAWFKPTTWGQLDLDRAGAMMRHKPEDLPLYDQQTIEEVWFTGSHSDVGGGGKDDVAAKIALRWILSEAVHIDGGVLINNRGVRLLNEKDPETHPRIHPSQNAAWWIVEQIPRLDIDNFDQYPVRRLTWGSKGVRDPNKLRRGGAVYLHATAINSGAVQPEIKIRYTN